MKNPDPKKLTRMLGCSSDFEIGGWLGDMHVDGFSGLTLLKAADPDAKARKGELIEAVRAGKFVSLKVTARTFRQSKGKPNRRYLRLDNVTPERVATFANQPFLVDHDQGAVAARMGTILKSHLVEETQSRLAFEQELEVVDPEGVIRVLDGRIDRFSIGWFSTGPVLCTLHKVDVRSSDSCYCWPGDAIELDGKTQTPEWAFQEWAGKEVSGVNVPAVQHTNISDVREALSAELGIPVKRTRNNQGDKSMRFTRLAAALSLAALSDEADEGAAVSAVEALQRRASTAESNLSAARTEVTQLKAALGVAKEAGTKIQVDALLQQEGYGAGKLRYGRDEDGNRIPSARETRLRRIAKDDGIEALRAELAEMEVVVPAGRRSAVEGTEPPPVLELGDGAENPYLADVCAQLGVKIEDARRFQREHMIGEG